MAAGILLGERASAPSNPSAARQHLYIDSADEILKGLKSDGSKNIWTPTSSYWRTIFTASGVLPLDAAAGTYMLGWITGVALMVSGTSITTTFRSGASKILKAADLGTNPKLRIRGGLLVNATQPTLDFTFGLHAITCAGAADQLNITYAAASGNTKTISSPALSTPANDVTTSFDPPADGVYGLGLVTSAGLTNNSEVFGWAELQVQNVS